MTLSAYRTGHVLPVLAAVFCGLVLFCASAGAQTPFLVRVDAVVSQPLSQTVPVIGRLVASQAGEVAARIDGPIASFEVEVGDRVAKGDIIAVLNDDILESRRDLAEAALALAKAQLETNRAEAALTKQALDRMERLRKSAAFSQARYDDAHQQVNIALQRVREAQAMIARAEAELRFNQINLDYTKVSAPYDGVITRRLTETGAYVQVGDPVVFMVADQNLEVEAEVPFERLAGLQEGTATDFSLDDGTHHRAIVRAVLPSENPLTRTRVVRFTPHFNGFIARLANAQSVTVSIPAGAARDVLSVHKDAIIRRLGKTVVYVVVGDKAEARTIEIGEGLGERLEVLSGLKEGELVVTRGNERLTPGAQVQIDGAS